MTSLLALAMVMNATGSMRQADHTCLGFVSTNLAKGSDNFYTYYRFSNKRLVFKAGDVLVYDVFLDPRCPSLKGGIDIDLNGALSMREHKFVDQNGIPAHGDGILTPAKGAWYTRRIALDSMPGLEAISWNVVFEGDAAGKYAQFLDDVHIERADGTRFDVYEGGPAQRRNMLIANGYSTQPFLADVPRREVTASTIDTAVHDVEVIGTRINTLVDMRRGVEIVQETIGDTAEAKNAVRALDEAEASAHSSKEQFGQRFSTLQKQLLAASPVIKQYQGDLVGYAHTDVEWLWEWPEARQAVFVTWRQALKFMDEFPDFTFTQSTAGYYKAMEETYPELFKQVQKRVKEGRWEIVGGRITEADENLLSAEAHARHFLYGQRYFRERFGKIATVGWEPDTFGHTAQMPQILKLAGLDSYYFCRAGKDKPLFWWEALDGSKVLTFDQVAAGAWYNGPLDETTPHELIPWRQKTGLKEMMWVYGVGNHGGGPTRENIQTGHKIQAAKYEPAAKFTTATAFFKSLRAQNLTKLPTIQSELNPVFDGCYTSQARMKLLNDQAEAETSSAEAVSATASLFGFKYPGAQFRQNWETIGFNQHHDTICGSSFHWAYLKTLPELEGVVAGDKVIARHALEHLTAHVSAGSDGTTVLVYNPVGWSRSGWVDSYVPMSLFGGKQPDVASFEAVSPDGKVHPVEVVDATTGAVRFLASDIPSFGYSVFNLRSRPTEPLSRLEVKHAVLENRYLRVEFDDQKGTIKSMIDKRTGREMAGPNGLAVLENHLEAANPDAWNLNSIVGVFALPCLGFYHVGMIPSGTTPGLFADEDHRAPYAVLASPGTSDCFVLYSLTDPGGGKSKITQAFHLSPESDHLDVTVTCDWRAMGNTGKPSPLLRVAFDVAAAHPTAAYQVPFGAITRPTDGKEMPAQNWADVSGDGAGVSIVEQGKHGFSCSGSTMRMSLIRSYDHPDFEPNLGVQTWQYQIVPHAGDWKSADGARRAAELAEPLMPIVVPPDSKGNAPATWAPLRLSDGSVVPTCLKKAEDDDSLVFRAYESTGKEEVIDINGGTLMQACDEVNLLEDPVRASPRVLLQKLPFKPFEIKTFKIKLAHFAEPK